MKTNDIIDAISHIDGDLIKTYFDTDEKLQKKRARRKVLWLRFGAIAASFGLIVSVCLAFLIVYLGKTPIYDEAHFTAEEVADVFPITDGETNRYTEVYCPSDRSLDIAPLPTEEYLPVYHLEQQTKRLSGYEFQSFANGILPSLTAALGEDIDTFEKTATNGDDWLTISYSKDEMTLLYFFQSSNQNSVSIRNHQQSLALNGNAIEIDHRMSEAETLASLAGVRDILFDVFDHTFSSAKVQYRYDGLSDWGAWSAYVYYYDEIMPDGRFGDYICIEFDALSDSSSETAGADMLQCCDISYNTYRISPRDKYQEEALCRRISLEDAEELLKQGYVFGNHVCDLCMQAQEKVSFEEYDFVGFEYVSDSYSDRTHLRSIPFYTFYKKIGVAENGNIIYAKTYVCAIAIKEIDEYFEAQEEKHVKSQETPYATKPE